MWRRKKNLQNVFVRRKKTNFTGVINLLVRSEKKYWRYAQSFGERRISQ